jgi:hypothetical protein
MKTMKKIYNLKEFGNSIGSYLMNLLEGADKFLNAFVGGNNEVTISARVGYYSQKYPDNWFWVTCRKMIDISFYPYQGWGHCVLASENETDKYFNEGGVLSSILLFVGTFIVCVILSIISYTYGFIKYLNDFFKD